MKVLRTYLLPGFIFQSLIIGGGYGTGRELVEFFMLEGPGSGLAGMAVATLIWSVVLAVSFELARATGRYDYRSFLAGLLGRGWVAYEVVYLVGLVLVVSVLGSAAGTIAAEMVGWPEAAGNVVVIVLVGLLAFFGSAAIERVMSVWSVALYGVFAVVLVMAFGRFGPAISGALSETAADGGNWLGAGAAYAAYNVGLVPAILFVVRHLPDRRTAIISGALAGPLAMLPGLLIYLAMLAGYPAILAEAVPSDYLLATLDAPVVRLVFQVILFGTFIETGTALVHGFNERLAGVAGPRMTGAVRAGVAAAMLVTALFVAEAVGLVDLIRSGYGALTWGYWVVFVIPVLTVGVYRLLANRSPDPAAR